MDKKRTAKILKAVTSDPDNCPTIPAPQKSKSIKKKSSVSDNNKKETTPHSNINTDEAPHKHFAFYTCAMTWQDKPVTESFIQRLGENMVKWAREDKDALKVSQFWLLQGISSRDFYNWCEKYPHLKTSHEIAVELIGNRREICAIKKQYDAGMIHNSMPLYDKQWKELYAWKAKVKSELEAKDAGPQIVVIERVPSSDVVPERKE